MVGTLFSFGRKSTIKNQELKMKKTFLAPLAAVLPEKNVHFHAGFLASA